MSQVSSGWLAVDETWTRASNTTFTIAGDKTDKYQKGDKIKLTQTTVKYFYVIGVSYSSPNTTITVTGGSDYSLASATITEPYFSKVENPQGFPNYFSFTPTWQALTTNPSIGNGTIAGRFMLQGVFCKTFYLLQMGSSTTYGTGAWILSLPIPASIVIPDFSGGKGNFHCADSTPGGDSGGANSYNITDTTIVFDNIVAKGNVNATRPLIWASGDVFRGEHGYFI